MREFAAGFGPYVVDETIIIGCQKGAGYFLEDVIIVLIDPQVLIDELLGLLAQVFGNALNVFIGKEWSCSFTAVGTGETVSATEFLLVQLLHLKIQLLWRFLFQPGEKFLILLMFIFGPLREPIYLFLHAAKINRTRT